MKVVPINDRGQFRYADFMSYIPEYLQEEPDVVELLQVLSDYINDAYRNIEDVEEFEFKLVAAESRVEVAKKKLARLVTMFKLASSRKEKVCYLSVPRANVKSNVVFGKATGHTPIVFHSAMSTPPNTITGLQTDGRLDMLSDGDVVYVTFTGASPEVTRAYYWSEETRKLTLEPEGSSQDPFTGTPNGTARMISFNVDDISEIHSRFACVKDYLSYYEVFFSARITDVESVPAVEKVRLDASGYGMDGEYLVVDYYGTGDMQDDTSYRTTMGFYGKDGWKWQSGFPAGMFYLRDTSAAGLGYTGDSREEMAGDQAKSPSLAKYPVVGKPAKEYGCYVFELSSPIPQYDGGRFYLVNRRGDVLGEFEMAASDDVSGNYSVTMRAVKVSDDYDTLVNGGDLFLVDFPVFANRGVVNADAAVPRIRWRILDDGQVNWATARLHRMDGGPSKVCGPIEVVPSTGEDSQSYTFRVSAGTRGLIEAFIGRNPTGRIDHIFAEGGKPWAGENNLVSCKTLSDGRGMVTMQKPIVHAEDVTLYAPAAGTVYVDGDGNATCDEYSEYLFSVSLSGGWDAVNLLFVLEDIASNEKYYRLAVSADGTHVEFDKPLPEGEYMYYTVGERYEGYAAKLSSVSMASGVWTADCGTVRGDVFTRGMFYAVDSDGRHAVIEVGEPDDEYPEVFPFEPGKVYDTGTLVYSDGKVYRAGARCNTAGAESAAELSCFQVDTLSRYTVPYRSSTNMFIPYYGPVKSMEYGEEVNYDGEIDVSVLPLYIVKVQENRLKYGWEHREFLNYGTNINLDDRARNGSVDLYSSALSNPQSGIQETVTANDAVAKTLDSIRKWTIDYPVVKYGCGGPANVDIDNYNHVPVETTPDGTVVTFRSADHGLVDGSIVMIYGYLVDNVSIDGWYNIDVPDGDTFTVTMENPGVPAGVSYAMAVEDPDSPVKPFVKSFNCYLQELSKVEGNEAEYPGDQPGIAPGKEFDVYAVAGMPDGISPVPYHITVESVDRDNCSFTYSMPDGSTLPDGAVRLVIAGESAEGDYVSVGDDIYLVSSGEWTKHDRQSMAEMSVLFSKANLMTSSVTNPTIAVGPAANIESIGSYDPETRTCLVRLNEPIEYFTADNADIINNNTMVRVYNVTPPEYNGWHTVTEVYGPKAFRMTVVFREGTACDGVGINGGRMRLADGRWYAFGVDSIEWEKVGNRVTYSLSNTVKGSAGTDIVTTFAHGLSAGDRVLFGAQSEFLNFDSTTGAPAIISGVVAKVTGDFSFVLETGSGDIAEGMVVARGVMLTHYLDDLGSLNGEYTHILETYGGKTYRFRGGDIVVACAQQNQCEVKCWRVDADGPWLPVKQKRSMKISSLSVDKYPNTEFDGGADQDGLDPFVYRKYTDVDVANYEFPYYLAGFRSAIDPSFKPPSLPGMDTTRHPMGEYSSAEDFSTVAPRDGMKPGFKGIPSMKYPLVEKIERLCYLRDASVIDYELIEYLARFLGYDITSMADDVTESTLYRTVKERELAVRETVANLPQYYALGGTKAGLHMLMSTFGVISEAVTLWTDARHPYQDMISRDEVKERVESGDRGQWVPTPYIDIVVTDHSSYPQFAVRQGDFERIKEQIRVYKPINVVFRDVILKIVSEIKVNPTATISGITVSGTLGANTYSDDGETSAIEVDYSDGNVGKCTM